MSKIPPFYQNMLSFKDYLLEGKLSQPELEKVRDGVKRADFVLDWIKKGESVEIDGVKTKIKFISDTHEKMFLKGQYKSGRTYQPLFQDDKGNLYKITDIDKTPEFGGGSGSGGGASNTKSTESAQCVYAQAYWDDNKTQFTPDDLKAAYSKVDVNAKLDEVLNITDEWKMSCITGARILKSAVKGKSMKFHRGSTWVKAIEKRWKTLNKNAGFPFSDLNKWNPADIWMCSDNSKSTPLLNSDTLVEMNDEMHMAFQAKDIYGVSLKLMKGATHVQTVNYKENPKVPTYTGKTIGKRSFYKSKDVYLQYEGGEIQFRGFGGRLDNWQGELGGAHAKLGKVGKGSIDAVLKKLRLSTIPDESTLMTRVENERQDFIEKDFFPLVKAEGVERSLKSFQTNLKTNKKINDILWMKSKYLGLYLFKIIKGKEAIVTQSLITYASSASELSSVHLKLM